jgi:hypothetical protein
MGNPAEARDLYKNVADQVPDSIAGGVAPLLMGNADLAD